MENLFMKMADVERVDIQNVHEILKDLYNYIDDDIDLYNPLTGEMVCGEELPRVLGILNALAEDTIWQVVGK